MSVNSSSTSNDSLLHLSIKSYIPSSMYCFVSTPGSLIYTTFYITNLLILLPLCISVLYLGLQRWRQHSSTSTAATMSHADCFTYHMVTIELFGVFGYTVFIVGIFRDHVSVILVGFCLWSFTWYGEMLFHGLTCVEHYLAVVHPITYLSLRRERGIRIRNITIGCVWLLCFGAPSVMISEIISLVVDFSILILSLIVISFCCLSVLCVLIRPGPGEQGGGRKRVDKSKLRAFYTIVAIMGVLLLRCTWNLLWFVLYIAGEGNNCVMMVSGVYVNFPSSLVLPLLFLYRAEALACCKKNTK